MRTKKGFTLIELLVVIAIIALLLSIIVPSLKKAKEYARHVICQSNLKQFSTALEMYEQEHNYMRFVVRQGSETVKYWMGKIAPYIGDTAYGERYMKGEIIDVLMCPSAPAQNQTRESMAGSGVGFWGAWNRPWEWTRGPDMTTLGGYGINGWVVYDSFYHGYDSEPEAYTNWLNIPANVPIFGECVFPIAWVRNSDKIRVPSRDELWNPTEATYLWSGTSPGLWRWAIPRHGMRTNIVFKDGSVRPVELKDICSIQWNKAFQKDGIGLQFK
ncbi:MAG TPA: type II secretion system protein [Anaerohalosphaeraceae bacterium]|nr:type II secretion system protein [Anaerohalosphaeraceae bacterium]